MRRPPPSGKARAKPNPAAISLNAGSTRAPSTALVASASPRRSRAAPGAAARTGLAPKATIAARRAGGAAVRASLSQRSVASRASASMLAE